MTEPVPSPREPRLDDDGALRLADVVRFGERYGVLLVGLPLAAMLFTAFVLRLTLPRAFEATTTLVATRGVLESEEVSGREMETYRRLLTSDAVLEKTRAKLVERGQLPKGATLAAGANLEARLLEVSIARRRQETVLAPVIDLVARREDAEQAAAVVNAWANTFVDVNREVLTAGTKGAVQAVEARLRRIARRMAEIEAELVAAERALGDERRAWEVRSAHEKRELRAQRDAAVGAHLAETKREYDRLRAAAGPGSEGEAKVYDVQRGNAQIALEAEHGALEKARESQELAEREALTRRLTALRDGFERRLEPLRMTHNELGRELALVTVAASRVDGEPLRIAARAAVARKPLRLAIAPRALAVGIGVGLLAFVYAVLRELRERTSRAA